MNFMEKKKNIQIVVLGTPKNSIKSVNHNTTLHSYTCQLFIIKKQLD